MRGIWILDMNNANSGTLPSSVKFEIEDDEESSDDDDTGLHQLYSEETSSDVEGEADIDNAKISTMTSSFGVLAIDDVDEGYSDEEVI
jgi:hypothetical protein